MVTSDTPFKKSSAVKPVPPVWFNTSEIRDENRVI